MTQIASDTSHTPAQDEAPIDTAILGGLTIFLLFSAFSIAVEQIGYFVALGLWIGKMVVRRHFGIPRTPVDLFVVLFVAVELLSAALADDKAYAFLYAQRRVLLLPIVYLIIDTVRTPRDLKLLVLSMILSTVAASVWGMRDIILHLGEYLNFERRLAQFQIYMTVGGLLMLVLLMLLPLIVHRHTPRGTRFLAIGGVLLLGMNLLFTFTRSSWLGLLAGVAVIGIRRSPRLFLAVGGIILLIVMTASPAMLDRITSIVDPSHPTNITRVNMWKTGFRIVHDHPIFGVGDVGMETVWNEYSDPGWGVEGHLHSNIMMWLATLGLAGFIVLAGLFVKLWIALSAIERSLRDDWLYGSVSLGALAAMAGFHVNGLFEWNFGDAEVIMLLWAIIGLTFAAEKLAKRSSV